MKRPHDTIGKVARYTLACCIAVIMVAGIGLMQAQDAIDEARAQQQALACFQAPRMCLPGQAGK